MAGPWDAYAAPQQGRSGPWAQFAEPTPSPERSGSGVWDSLVAGYQGSATGLALRGRLPDVALDPQHSKWYERAISGAASTVADLPEMVAGGIGGALAGSTVGPVGTVLVGGAGAFAVPAAIRESLVQAYTHGQVTSSADFLQRTSIVLKETGKAALVGAATAGTGMLAGRTVGAVIAPAIGESIGVGGARVAIGAAQTVAEVGTMAVAPAALEGKLPEPEDFVNAAIVVAGMKTAGHVSGKLANIYARTGTEPEQVVADAQADPELKRELAAGSPDELPKAYQPAAEAEMLREALPEPLKVADVMANPRGEIPQGKEPNHINYSYSEAPEDVQALRAKIAETFKPEIEAARGKQNWDATRERAEDIIRNRLAGMSDDRKAELTSMSFSDLAAQSLAVEAMAERAAYDAKAAAEELAKKGDAATPEDSRRLAAAIEQAALIHAIDQGNGAEIARALNARKAARQRGQLAEGLQEALAQYGEDPHVLARMVLGLHTTAELTRFAKEASKATTWEKVVEAWKAGILSGPVTHMANIVGNGTFMAMRPIVDMAAALIPRGEVSILEPFGRALGNLQGAKNALVFAGEALRVAYGDGGWKGIKGVASEIAVGEDAKKSEQFRKAIEGTKGDIIRLPFRALSLADDFFRVANSEGEKYALAMRKASKEGNDVISREFRQRVADLVQNDPKIAERAAQAAERFTFNSPLGEKGQAVQNLIKKANLQLVVPFIRTPANVFKEMIRMTPLAPIIGEWRAAYEAGGAERSKAIAEMGMGMAISGVVASYALDGSITGAGPADPKKREALIDSGWQPYSVKIGKKYYSYQRLQPLGTLMGMSADLAEVWEHVTAEEGNKAATMLSVAFANAVTQQTFLSGITSVVQVLADPQRYGPRFAQQYLGSVVPAVIAQPTAMLDPIQREINSLADAVKARVPVLRKTLEPKINALTGEVMEAKERLGEVAPVTESIKIDDPVLMEAARLRVSVSPAPKALELPAMNDRLLGKVELTPEERTYFATKSGQLTHQMLSLIVNSEQWQTMPDIARKRIFETVIEEGHKAARATVLSPERRIAESQRIAAELKRKLAQ